MAEITPKLVCDYSVATCSEYGVKCDPTENAWVSVVQGANGIIQQHWGHDNPSPFKRAAAAAIAIVSCAPIDPHFPAALIQKNGWDQEFAKLPKITKAVVAHDFATFVLHGAAVGDAKHAKVLSNPIDISTHFYRDLIWLLTRAGFENGNLFNPLALIYEACAYQTNPEAQYPRG